MRGENKQYRGYVIQKPGYKHRRVAVKRAYCAKDENAFLEMACCAVIELKNKLIELDRLFLFEDKHHAYHNVKHALIDMILDMDDAVKQLDQGLGSLKKLVCDQTRVQCYITFIQASQAIKEKGFILIDTFGMQYRHKAKRVLQLVGTLILNVVQAATVFGAIAGVVNLFKSRAFSLTNKTVVGGYSKTGQITQGIYSLPRRLKKFTVVDAVAPQVVYGR